jgi:hypothetical protein
MSTTIRSGEHTETTAAGPIEYLVVEFPAGHRTGENLPLLVDLVNRGIIRLLDLVFLRRGTDGSVSAIALADLDGDGELDLAVFDGASSGVVTEDDLQEAGAVLEPGSSAAVVVYENLWAAPMLGALHRCGARLVAGGFIPHDAMIVSLDATETAVPTTT